MQIDRQFVCCDHDEAMERIAQKNDFVSIAGLRYQA